MVENKILSISFWNQLPQSYFWSHHLRKQWDCFLDSTWICSILSIQVISLWLCAYVISCVYEKSFFQVLHPPNLLAALNPMALSSNWLKLFNGFSLFLRQNLALGLTFTTWPVPTDLSPDWFLDIVVIFHSPNILKFFCFTLSP